MKYDAKKISQANAQQWISLFWTVGCIFISRIFLNFFSFFFTGLQYRENVPFKAEKERKQKWIGRKVRIQNAAWKKKKVHDCPQTSSP